MIEQRVRIALILLESFVQKERKCYYTQWNIEEMIRTSDNNKKKDKIASDVVECIEISKNPSQCLIQVWKV